MTGSELLALAMFASFITLILTGFPVAWVLGGLAVLFTALAIAFEIDLGIATGVDWNYTSIAVERIWGVMGNWVMVALPMFIFMGLLLDRSGIAHALMTSFSRLFGRWPCWVCPPCSTRATTRVWRLEPFARWVRWAY